MSSNGIFLQTIKDSILINNNYLVSRILVYQFKIDMMLPQRAKELQK